MLVLDTAKQSTQHFLLSPRESLLLRLLFGREEPDRERLLYEDLDFDRQKQSFLLLLARLAKRSDFFYTPDALVPRLQGLARYHAVQNKVKAQPVIALLDCLSHQQTMLYSHCAMYAHYDGEQPRIMGIGDVCVEPGRSTEALLATENAGMKTESESSLAAFLKCGQGNVNLHKLIHLQADARIWQRRKPIRFQNRQTAVPDCADSLILLLRSEFRWQCVLPQHTSNIKWYYDCACLLQHPEFPGWDALSARAAELGSLQTLRFMLSLFDQALPGWIPDGFFDRLPPQAAPEKLFLALDYGSATKRYEDAKAGAFLPRLSCWIAWMRSKYHYLNSEISFTDPPVSVWRMLRQHWGISGIGQVPGLIWSRAKRIFSRKGNVV